MIVGVALGHDGGARGRRRDHRDRPPRHRHRLSWSACPVSSVMLMILLSGRRWVTALGAMILAIGPGCSGCWPRSRWPPVPDTDGHAAGRTDPVPSLPSSPARSPRRDVLDDPAAVPARPSWCSRTVRSRSLVPVVPDPVLQSAGGSSSSSSVCGPSRRWPGSASTTGGTTRWTRPCRCSCVLVYLVSCVGRQPADRDGAEQAGDGGDGHRVDVRAARVDGRRGSAVRRLRVRLDHPVVDDDQAARYELR